MIISQIAYLFTSLEKVIKPYQVCNMPHASSVTPMSIPDPAFVKRKVFLAKDAGNDHGVCLIVIDGFGL